MPRDKADKPKFGDLVPSNPNMQRLKDSCEEYLTTFEATGEPLLSWPQPRTFAEQFGFRNIDSDTFRTAYYKVRAQVEGKILQLSTK